MQDSANVSNYHIENAHTIRAS